MFIMHKMHKPSKKLETTDNACIPVEREKLIQRTNIERLIPMYYFCMQSFQLSFQSCVFEILVKQQVRERNLREDSLSAEGLFLSRCLKSKLN